MQFVLSASECAVAFVRDVERYMLRADPLESLKTLTPASERDVTPPGRSASHPCARVCRVGSFCLLSSVVVIRTKMRVVLFEAVVSPKMFTRV